MSANVRVQVLRHDGPFNYSTLNNMGARAARGSILGLINNDIEVIEADWLKEMVVQAIRPRIGAVGAKLLYADGRVQHAGVIVGLGGYAGHSHRFFDAHAAGYQKRLASPQYLSAVTAACLVVEAKKYWEVGGLDENAFVVAYNDVDFCLKLGAAGYKNVYTPYATLFHLESASRGLDLTGEKLARYEREKAALLDRWWPIVRDDPFYNPNLTRTYEDFSLGE
jgi:GT2 family glycosyltransferase